MLKYIGNAFHSILPSVIATCIGAYIVNHYINKPDTPPAPAAAVVAPSEPKKPEEAKAATGDAGAAEAAKSKAADKPVAARLHQPNPREKVTAEKTSPKPAAAPSTVAAVNAAPSVEANPARDERRDANDLARAAIERLRNSGSSSEAPRAAIEPAPRLPEPPRTAELPHAAPVPAASSVAVSAPAAPVGAAIPIAPLPPAVNVAPVAAAPAEPTNHPATTASLPPRAVDPLRPTPPAEIPAGDRIEASADGGRSLRTVGDDVVSAARSVIHAVIPR